MNLFLLASVPLFALVLHRLFAPSRPPFADPKAWIIGSVWSIVGLVAVAPLGKLREFGGDLGGALAGLILTDGILFPGGLLVAWTLTRPRRDSWELTLWLALAFSMAGIRDFVSTTGVSDLNELFLVPLDRILILIVLPPLLAYATEAKTAGNKVLGWMASVGLVLTGPIFQVLSFGGWGWTVWILAIAGIGAGLWWQKKTALIEGGSSGLPQA